MVGAAFHTRRRPTARTDAAGGLGRWGLRLFVAAGVAGILSPIPAAALPVFARIYDKPCGACHTTFPQLNPAGENFRAHGFHGPTPAIEPLKVAQSVDVPGTLPLAFYLGFGEDLAKVENPGQPDPTRTRFSLEFFRLLAGGEIGRHVAFMLDYELVETDFTTGDVTTDPLPYLAYLTAHAARGEWLGNLKAGWYELPFIVSPQIHRLSTRPYLIYELNACTLLGVAPPHRQCGDIAKLGETQIGFEVSALQASTGIGWAAGFTNGSNNRFDSTASRDAYVHLTRALGLHQIGLFAFYSPDLIGQGTHDHALRLGPDVDFYRRQFRLLGQFLTGYDSNPTGHHQSLWYYGGFLEADYRLTTTLLSLLRVDYAWTPRFDDTTHGGTTDVRRRLWEVTHGWQWLVLENVKAVAEVTYGESRQTAGDGTVNAWTGTLRLVTAFWPFTPPGVHEWLEHRGPP